MEQRWAGIVGDEVHFDLFPGRNDYYVLEDSRRRLLIEARELPSVPMQMDRVGVRTLVVEDHAITLSGRDDDRLGVGISLTVDGEMMAVFRSLEHQRNAPVGFRSDLLPAEAGVVPRNHRQRFPARFALLVGVFHDDAHALVALAVPHFAQDPNAGIVHFNDRVHAFSRSDVYGCHRGTLRDWVAVQRYHLEAMAWQRQLMRFGGAGVQDSEQHALGALHANGLARAQHFAVD